MKKTQQLKIFTTWEDIPEKAKKKIDDCEYAIMANEIEELPENTEKEKMVKVLQLQKLQKFTPGGKS
jgi:hypothetical protein